MTTPVTFELAKLLKEKGIIIKPLFLKHETDYVEGYDWDIEDEEDSLKVREFQFEDNICSHLYLAPTISEVVMWLYEKYGIWIVNNWQDGSKTFIYEIIDITSYENTIKIQEQNYKDVGEAEYNSPAEAYSAAIEYTLNNLI